MKKLTTEQFVIKLKEIHPSLKPISIYINNNTKIEISKLGMNAGVLGAIALGLNRFIFKLEMGSN